ncbi:MAG TPA: mucoidy inhibitor MuiA family protein [Nannocystis exedens]|nr:mucoidy inhibitor MuiA family protein [Nannocystis exedens]
MSSSQSPTPPADSVVAWPTPIELPVDEVILLEDRAHVIRRGVIEVPAGTTRLCVAEVAPVLSDRTLCAALRRPGAECAGEEVRGARVMDLRLHRRVVARVEDRPEQAAALERERIDLADRIAALEAERSRVRIQLGDLDRIVQDMLVDIGIDAGWGQAQSGRWLGELTEICADEATLRQRILVLNEELGELSQELERLLRRAAKTADLRERTTAELVIEVVARAPGRFSLQVDYIVPGACWRPYHRAEWISTEGQESAESSLEFVSEGCVWQRTGEDWRNVQLVFSTERASLGSEPPTLATDLLQIRRRREQVEVEVRDQEIQSAGLGAEPETRAATEVPGIDDGGEILALRALSRASVPSDGQPHRVRLFSFTTEAEVDRILFAELETAVLLRSTQSNRGPHPLLAGPVDLIQGGGLVGRTSILYIAPGERFELGFGPDSALRAIREVELAKEERGMLSSWTSVRHTVSLRLSNLGGQVRRIKVSERVPVSEIDRVKIDFSRKKTSEGKSPDSQGIVSWQVELGPFERRRLQLCYTLRKHDDVRGLDSN